MQKKEEQTVNNKNEKRKEYGKYQPNIEMYTELSKDGKYFIHKVVISFVKPLKYVTTIMENFGLSFPKVSTENKSSS